MAKKTGLGKGLESLMSGADAETGISRQQLELPLSSIRVNKSQPRKHFDERELEELTQSIKEHGVLQPILVRKKGAVYEIVAGERRYQASKRAGLKKVPAVIKDIKDDQTLKLALIENLQRSDLNPIEEARAYKQLIDELALTQEELGVTLSKSRSAIANTMRLLDLPQDIQQLMVEGVITAGHARALLAVSDTAAQQQLAQKVVTEHLSVRSTENLASLLLGSTQDRKPRATTPQSYKRAAKQLRSILHAKVKVKRVGEKNKIEIEFDSDAMLARVVRALERGYEDENDEL